MIKRLKEFNYFLNSLNLPLLNMLIVSFSLLFCFNVLQKTGEQQFVYLANSFLHGKLYFLQSPGTWNDTTLYYGRYYWPLGPFPAIVSIPFVFFFGNNFNQGYIQFFLNLINFFLLYKIAYKILRNSNSSLWISFAYIFASPYLLVGMVPWSWWFAQVVGTTLILLSIYEFLSNRRWLLIGTYISLAGLTRFSLFSLMLFFVIFILTQSSKDKKIKNSVMFLFPICIGGLFLSGYNYLRFNNFLENGYSFSIVHLKQLATNREFGLWSFIHFPANLYYLFLKGPEAVFIPGTKILKFPYIYPDTWGMSIFFTSPFFLWISKVSWKKIEVKLAGLTVLVSLFILLGYYGIGVNQFGYRYGLDFYPFLFIILCYSFKRSISLLLKTVIVGSFFFNLYLILLFFNAKI